MLRRIPLLLLGLLLSAPAQARPDPQQRLGETLVERGSAHYRFEHFELDAADGQRRYRVRLGVPRLVPPATGFPVLYLLDGNAALAALREDWLGELRAGQPPLLVLIGPASDQRLDLAGRVFDYTPVPPGDEGAVDAALGDRPSGGAARFRQLLLKRIATQVASRVPVDPARQGLWGHSLGGLFVLDTLSTTPAAFQYYIAASPSLWWQSGLLLQRDWCIAAPARLLILQGGAERPVPGEVPESSPRARAMAAVPDDAARQLAQRLDRLPNLDASYRQLAGLQHGPMLAASLRPALRLVAGLAPFAEE